MHVSLVHYLVVSLVLFGLGLLTLLTRRNAVGVLLGVELILNAAGLNFIAFSHYVTGGVAGQVREISLRSTTVITNDNMAIIVPNADFITQRVTNWSYEDPRVRFRIPFGVAYGTDLPKLRKLMLLVAEEHPKALKQPEPELFFVGFGNSSLNFELAVWSSESTLSPRRFHSDLFFAIEKKLRESGIEIPFPQQDLHVRTLAGNARPVPPA